VTNEQILDWKSEALLAEVVGYETDEVAHTASGSAVRTYRGAEYLDFTSGIAVHACGHNQPEVVAAIRAQAELIVHTSDVMRHAPQLELARFLRDLLSESAPGEPWAFQFMNSGSESIDTAAKLALKATGRTRFIAFQGGFHGRTLFGTALSCSNRAHWEAYEPFLSSLRDNILHAPQPRADSRTCIPALEALLDKVGDEVAALFFEPQQGEGGYFPISAEIGKQVRELTQRHGILLIADEIQCGFGRTGRWFGFENLGIVPDIVVFGKAVGGGLPLAGIAAPKKLMSRWSPGEHGTTFGGNPIACAAGLAALRYIDAHGLVERAAALGEHAKARLCPLLGKYGVSDVRGNGMMIGIEFRDAEGLPDYGRTGAIKAKCRDGGLLVLSCGARIGEPGVDNSTIRLLPPLNISFEELDRGLEVLAGVIAATGSDV